MKTQRWVASGIAIAIALVVAACADSVTSPRAHEGAQSGLVAGPPGRSLLDLTLLSCTPLTADTTVQEVGPSGGTINVGPHSLYIPSGALDSTVTITAIAPSDTINRVHFEPEGLEFHEHAWLTMSYANCDGLLFLPLKRVVYVDDDLSLLDLLVSIDSWFTKKTTGKLEHFSDYVVAW